MTNFEHIIENTLDAFSEGYTPEQIESFIKSDVNFPEQPLTVEQIFEICQYVWCTYLDYGNMLKKESTTNAEKLAKEMLENLDNFAQILFNGICDLYSCENCPLQMVLCSDKNEIKKYLESEVEDEKR